ncbi:P-loop containing nucleoside triphosphate hydrolase protein [Aspergillus varians]
MASCQSADAAFGPRVSVTCRTFDFTLVFEDVFLASLPAALFLLCLPFAIWLLRDKGRQIQRSTLLGFKLGALSALFVCQIAFLLVRQLQLPTLRNHVSLPADVLEVVAIASAGLLSYIHHCRSIRPSTLLVLFISARSLLGMARVRTLWLIPTATNAAIPFTVGFAVTLLSMVLESTGKESSFVAAITKPATPEPFSGLWKRASFAWLAGTFRQGYAKVLSVEDLPDLDPQLNSQIVARRLQRTWAHTAKLTRFALLRACLRAYISPLLSVVIPRLLMTGFTFCQPFLINKIVSWVGERDASLDSGKALIGGYALVYVGQAVSTALYGYQNFRFVIRLRGGLISLVHRQTVHARAVDLGETTAITLMGTDVERIVNGFRSIHELWASLVDIAIAVYLLERQVGVACVVPALIVVVFISATFKLSAATNKYQRLWIEKVQDRLRLTSYALEQIKSVKMLGLSEKIFSIIQGLRRAEIATSAVFRKLLIGTITLSNSPADLAPMATFAVYVIIALVRHDNSILAAQAFTSLSLISLVTSPVLTFIQAVPTVIQCLGCFDRIQEYCSVGGLHDNKDSDEDNPVEKPDSIDLQNLPTPAAKTGQLVQFSNQSFAWKQESPPVLHDINVNIQHGRVTMIVGPIGSGKSTLLESILGETLTTQEQADRSFSIAAYCSQTPWLQSRTIRQNIISASPVDTTWYSTVVSACGLDKDLARLPRGDQTAVGNNGLTLSGGQKQRIALARALYSRCKVVLLDDVFSGIDAFATETISRNLFGDNGLFRGIQATVVLATHSGFLLRYADDLVVLAEGRVVDTGDVASLRSSNRYIQNMQTESPESSISIESSSELLLDPTVIEHENENLETSELLDHESPPDPTRQDGDSSVYAYYASAAGRKAVAAALVMIMGWSFCREFPTIWLDWWTAANAKNPNSRAGMYLGIYAFLGIAGMVLMVVGCWILCVNIVSNSALRLHNDLVDSTSRAPFQFFHRVDIGSITNRFSQDMDLIDMSLPLESLNALAAASTCLVKLIILAVFAKYLGIAIPFVVAIVYTMQKFYLRTSRQMRLLDIEAKAPLYTHFLEVVSGAPTIRAFRWHDAFTATELSLLNTSQRPVYMLYCIQQCLGFVLDMLVAGLAVILVATVVFMREKFDAGDVGVALLMVMTFNATLMQLVKFWTMMETSIGAIARVKSYVATTAPEEGDTASQPRLPQGWPSEGSIQFSDVTAAHSLTSPPVLKSISLTIPPGSKIAVCGSSGSGKTTLILALLRMVELQQGTMTIDGISLPEYSREEIRTRLNVITQEPFLVAGTVRFNIDPLGRASDEKIIAALRRLGLWEKITQQYEEKDKDGLGLLLEMEMDVDSWSLGQRQLLCLARAMVREGRVLILDEAMSSVDHETESTMQEVLETEFASHTVLSVLHRLRYTHRYDRVAVLDDGVLVEFDSPAALLGRESRFAELYRAGNY